MKNLLFTFGLIFGVIIQNSYEVIPPDIQLCKPEDTACISKTITGILKSNPNGRSDIFLPDLEPLKIDKLEINQNGAFKFQILFTNLNVYGISKLNIERAVGFKKDPHTSKFELYGSVPKIQFKSHYKANGRILILPIEGEGPSDIILESVKVSIKFKPLLTNKNGKTNIGVDKLKILLEPSNMKIQLDNLFNGDKALGENMNIFLNENWKDVWTELSPSIIAGIGDAIKMIVTNSLAISPYEDIYKKD